MFTLDVVSFIIAVVSLYAPNLNLYKCTGHEVGRREVGGREVGGREVGGREFSGREVGGGKPGWT